MADSSGADRGKGDARVKNYSLSRRLWFAVSYALLLCGFILDSAIGRPLGKLAGVRKWSSGPENLAYTAGGETEEEKQDRGRSVGAECTQRLSRMHTYISNKGTKGAVVSESENK